MTPSRVSKRVVGDRAAIISDLIRDLRALPLGDRDAFFADRRNVWAAESCLRRCLEALLDIGRHILAKGFGVGVTEYKEIATRLAKHGVLEPDEAEALRRMAGYRNRMVHFYHEITEAELHQLCAEHLGDIERLVRALLRWLAANPDKGREGI